MEANNNDEKTIKINELESLNSNNIKNEENDDNDSGHGNDNKNIEIKEKGKGNEKINSYNFNKDSLLLELLDLKKGGYKNYDNLSLELKKIEKRYYNNIKDIEKKNFIFLNPKDFQINNVINTIIIEDVIKRIDLPIDKKTIEDFLIIKNYLKGTSIEKIFYNELDIESETYYKLLTFLSIEMKVKKFHKNEIIFNIGDKPDYFYLIITGSLEILKPLPEKVQMTGFDYFKHLLELKKKGDNYRYYLCIQENKKNFCIDKKDAELIPYIYLKYKLENIRNVFLIDFEELLFGLNIKAEELDLDPKKVGSNQYIFSQLKNIKAKLPKISDTVLKHYVFIDDKIEKKEITIFKMKPFLLLEPKTYFGESTLNGRNIRNATIQIKEDSFLGYLAIDLYSNHFFEERKGVFDKKVDFLHSNFFFPRINLKTFQKKYFSWFIINTYINGNILYKEGEQVKFVFFVEEGTIELYSTKTILEIQIFLQELEERKILFEGKKEQQNIYNDIRSNFNDIREHIKKQQSNKVLILGKNDILALESFYYKIPYLTTAKVTSPKAKIIMIDIEHLYQILCNEKECLYLLKKKVKNKLKILAGRFFELNNAKLSLLDRRINQDEEYNYEQYISQNKKSKLIEISPLKHKEVFRKVNDIQNKELRTMILEKITNNSEIKKLKNKLYTSEENNINKKKRRLSGWNFPTIYDDLKRNKDMKLININKEKYKPILRNLVPFSIENNLLTKAKIQIKLLKKNKYFFSSINVNDSDKNKSQPLLNTDSKRTLNLINEEKKNKEIQRNNSLNMNDYLYLTQLEENNFKSVEENNFKSVMEFNKISKISPTKKNLETNLPSIVNYNRNEKRIFKNMSFITQEHKNGSFTQFLSKEAQNQSAQYDKNIQDNKYFKSLSIEENIIAQSPRNNNIFAKKFSNPLINDKFKLLNNNSFLKNKKQYELKKKKINILKGLNEFGFPIKASYSFLPKNTLNCNEYKLKMKKFQEYKRNIERRIEERDMV